MDTVVAQALRVDVVTRGIDEDDMLGNEWPCQTVRPHRIGDSTYIVDSY